MGIVHQTNYWVKSLNVLENVAMPLYLPAAISRPQLRPRMTSLEEVGMAEFARFQPTVLPAANSNGSPWLGRWWPIRN